MSFEHQLILLRIRSLIADKDMVTAQANLDIARAGEWRCDYAAWHGGLDADIQKLFDQVAEQERADDRAIADNLDI